MFTKLSPLILQLHLQEDKVLVTFRTEIATCQFFPKYQNL